jgi:hypothetical protein
MKFEITDLEKYDRQDVYLEEYGSDGKLYLKMNGRSRCFRDRLEILSPNGSLLYIHFSIISKAVMKKDLLEIITGDFRFYRIFSKGVRS